MKKNRRKALELLLQKNSGEKNITYKKIAELSGYERKQIYRLNND